MLRKFLKGNVVPAKMCAVEIQSGKICGGPVCEGETRGGKVRAWEGRVGVKSLGWSGKP